MDTRQLGQSIKFIRDSLGFTQDALSDKAGLAYSTLAKIEQGAIKNPSVFTVAAIANALGVTIETLLGTTITIAPPKGETSVKFVYLDLNGVMVRFYHHAFVSLSEEVNVPFDKVETTFWHYNDAANRGEITLDAFNGLMAKHLGVKHVDWQRYYMSTVQPIKETWPLLESLHKKYRIGLLTNTMPGFIREMQKRRLLPDFNFDCVIDSSVVGLVKPNDAMYTLAEKTAGCKGPEIFFIDDSRANLTAAEKFGWHVMWFDDYDPAESVQKIEQSLL